MITILRIFSSLTLPFLALILLFGCSREEGGIPSNVDISANIEKLKSNNPNERVEAAANLGMAGPKSEPAIPHLIPLLKDSDPIVRRLAAYALGEIGPAASEAVPQLQSMLRNDPDRDVRFQVVNTLRSIDPQSAPDVQPMNVTRP